MLANHLGVAGSTYRQMRPLLWTSVGSMGLDKPKTHHASDWQRSDLATTHSSPEAIEHYNTSYYVLHMLGRKY